MYWQMMENLQRKASCWLSLEGFTSKQLIFSWEIVAHGKAKNADAIGSRMSLWVKVVSGHEILQYQARSCVPRLSHTAVTLALGDLLLGCGVEGSFSPASVSPLDCSFPTCVFSAALSRACWLLVHRPLP